MEYYRIIFSCHLVKFPFIALTTGNIPYNNNFMNMITKLLNLSYEYCDDKKIVYPTLSSLIFNDGKTLSRLRNGSTITVRNYERAVEWLSDHWPEDKQWPDFIERPNVKERVEG